MRPTSGLGQKQNCEKFASKAFYVLANNIFNKHPGKAIREEEIKCASVPGAECEIEMEAWDGVYNTS